MEVDDAVDGGSWLPTMLRDLPLRVLAVVFFWFIRMEVNQCESMFSDVSGSASLAYPAIWPMPVRAVRAFYPRFAFKWVQDRGLRWLLAKVGLGLGVVDVVCPRARWLATPLYLFAYSVEAYCFFVKFGAHMHFPPLLLAVGAWAVDRRARGRGVFLLLVCAQTYVSTGLWRARQFAFKGPKPWSVEEVYGVSLRDFLTVLSGVVPATKRALLARTTRDLGYLFYATTWAFEVGVWVAVLALEARLAFGPDELRPSRKPAVTALRRCLAVFVLAFHWSNFFVMGMFFVGMGTAVAWVLWCEESPDAYAPAPRSHAFCACSTLVLAAASYHCREVFPVNSNGLFTYPSQHASFLATHWTLANGAGAAKTGEAAGTNAGDVRLSLLLLGPRQVAALTPNGDGGERLLRGALPVGTVKSPCPLGGGGNGWVAGRLPSPALRAFVDATIAAADARGLLDDPADALHGPKRRLGYPGVARLVRDDPRLRAHVAAAARAAKTERAYYDVVADSEDLSIVLAEVTERGDGLVDVAEVPPLDG